MITIANNWEVSEEFDENLFGYNPQIDNKTAMAEAYINVKYPPDSGKYRQTNRYANMRFKFDEDKEASIPLLYFRKNEDGDLISLENKTYFDNYYGITIDKTQGSFTRYSWNRAIVEDITDETTLSIIVPNDDYLDDDWNGPSLTEWNGEKAGYPFYIDTNLPVLEVTADFNPNHPLVDTYCKTRHLDALLAYSEVINIVNAKVDKSEKIWYIYNEYRNGSTSLLEGFVPNPNAVTIRKYEEIKAVGGELSMVRQADGTYSIVNNGATIIGSWYSTRDRFNYDAYPDEIHVVDGFVGYWDKHTVSESITCAINSGFKTNMYYYSSYDDYLDVIEGRKKPEDVAENPDKDEDDGKKPNPTGTKETSTELGKPTFKTVYLLQWALSVTDMANLAIELNNLSVNPFGWMYSNPIDHFLDLTYYPFNVAAISKLHSEVFHIGTWCSQYNLNEITETSDTLKLGSFEFYETYNSYEDFYSQSVQIWLPYIGLKQLDIKKFMGKRLTVEYAIDLFSHQCTCFIKADDKLIDYYNGNIGISLPLTATNFQQQATKMLDLVIGAGSNVISGDVGKMTTLPFEVSTTVNSNNFRETKGAVSSSIGAFSPQYVYLIFEKLTSTDNVDRIRELRGLPSNETGPLSKFYGYLSVNDVDLNCSRATETEKTEIESLLRSGIRI